MVVVIATAYVLGAAQSDSLGPNVSQDAPDTPAKHKHFPATVVAPLPPLFAGTHTPHWHDGVHTAVGGARTSAEVNGSDDDALPAMNDLKPRRRGDVTSPGAFMRPYVPQLLGREHLPSGAYTNGPVTKVLPPMRRHRSMRSMVRSCMRGELDADTIMSSRCCSRAARS